MSKGKLGNPACEDEKLFIQVMGKDHPDGHEIVIVDQHDGEPLEAFGSADTEKLQDPVSVLHQWNWQGYARVDTQLHIASESGEPIRLPLLEWLYKTPRQERLQHNIIQPVLPMALWESLDSREREALPLRAGYLYVFYRDTLWREIEVTANQESGRLEFRDIDLAAHRDEEGSYRAGRRSAVGVMLEEIWLPWKQDDRYVDSELRIAFSEVQWSAARLGFLEADSMEQGRRAHSIKLGNAEDYALSGRLYELEEAPPQRLRDPLVELQLAEPKAVTQDLAGDALSGLHDTFTQELEAFDAGGVQAREAAEAGQQGGKKQGETRSPAYLQAIPRLQVLTERMASGAEDSAEPPDTLWQQDLGQADDCLADARQRHIPGLAVEDTLFAMRHVSNGCQASLAYLQQLPTLAAKDKFYECAALVNRTILRRHDAEGKENELRRFVDEADLSDTGELSRILRNAQRELARHQFDTYQSALYGHLLSQEGHAVLADLLSLEGHDYLGAYALAVDLLQGLRESSAHADGLYDEPPQSLNRPQRYLVNVLEDGSGYTLHAMLFPSDEDSPLDGPLELPEEEINPGDGSVRLRALAALGDLQPPEEDDIQLLDTALLAGLVEGGGVSLVPELKRWSNAVSHVLGKMAEHAMLMLKDAASEVTVATIFPSVARLARAGLPDMLSGLQSMPPSQAIGKVVLGVADPTDGLVNGLTPADRQNLQSDLSRASDRMRSAVRDATGRKLTHEVADNLTHAAGDQALEVLVVDPDSKAAAVSRRARRQYSLSRSADAVRLPYIITVIEFFNLRQEWAGVQGNWSARAGAGVVSASIDLAVASTKALEFFGERHRQLTRLRAKAISRKVPWGEVIGKVFPSLAARLPAYATAITIFGAAAGALTAALFAWDAITSIRNGNWGAGAALGVAAAGTLVVAGSGLVSTSALWLGLGPVGWIALGLSIAGALVAMWLSDAEIEEWLRMGPFGTHGHRAPWLQEPVEAYDRLVSLFAGIRIRIERIAPMSVEPLVERTPPGIGLVPEATPGPASTIDRLLGEGPSGLATLSDARSPSANTRIKIESNLPGLAAGWEIQAHLRTQQAVDEPLISKGVQLGWLSGDMRPAARGSEPLFQRDTAHGVEYYVHTPADEVRGTGRDKTRTRHAWAVRVQWSRGVPYLPRVLPAPSPLTDPSDIPAGARNMPDFTEVGLPYWADETNDKDQAEDG
ncbi:toxin VasX [Halomonas salinarum]|uniref:toxin VasX n=1 Tax=Halomonas salinarum TaxID=1158993 RepID=UPI00143A2FB3|nr:toxin VasX [Halomonas salinarum]